MKLIYLVLTTLGLSAIFLQAPSTLYAADPPPPPDTSLFKNSKEEACAGAQLEATAAINSCKEPAQSSLNKLLKTVINLFSVVVGIIAVIMIMVSGLRFLTSGGDSNNISSAKNTLVYAIVGLVIVAFAQLIVRFVINKAAS